MSGNYNMLAPLWSVNSYLEGFGIKFGTVKEHDVAWMFSKTIQVFNISGILKC